MPEPFSLSELDTHATAPATTTSPVLAASEPPGVSDATRQDGAAVATTPVATAPWPPWTADAASPVSVAQVEGGQVAPPWPGAPHLETPQVAVPFPPAIVSNWDGQPAHGVAPLPVREPIAPDVTRTAATQPLMTMLIGGVLACALIGFGMFLQSRLSHNGPVDPINYVGTVSSESGNAIVQAVRRVGPAVLNVDTKFGKGAPLDFLPSPGAESQPREGKGTGFIFDSRRGLMLTNAHVVAGAQNIQITTRDGDVYSGRLLGSDRMSDIAVVAVSSKSLPAARLANLKNARDLDIGQWAIAIGNPFAQANTVTVGVVSAVGRAIPVPGHNGNPLQLTDMIQTDAAINPGNSGGPLCNIRGEVIGINTAIYGIGTGLGFSIPINKAKAVADQIITQGHVSHPYIGIKMQAVTDALQTDLGLKDRYGALVQAVEPKSPAARAQLQVGDVIHAVDRQKMKSGEDVQRYISGKAVGDVVKIDILRNSTVKKTLSLKIGDRPDSSDEVAPATPSKP